MGAPKPSRIISPLELVTSEIVGPSSSHTAGVMRIGRAIATHTHPTGTIKILLYNSLADTGDAHMTKNALVAGLLGWTDNDPRIPFSFRYAEDQGLSIKWSHKRDEQAHPNTLIATLIDNNGTPQSYKGISLGGGRFKLTHLHQHPEATP
jgi:L-serine dehydratase